MFRPPSAGKRDYMQIRKLIERRIRQRGDGTNVDADVQATIAANVGERGSVTKVSSHQSASAGRKRSEREPSDPA